MRRDQATDSKFRDAVGVSGREHCAALQSQLGGSMAGWLWKGRIKVQAVKGTEPP